jgi:hypothetical protein
LRAYFQIERQRQSHRYENESEHAVASCINAVRYDDFGFDVENAPTREKRCPSRIKKRLLAKK